VRCRAFLLPFYWYSAFGTYFHADGGNVSDFNMSLQKAVGFHGHICVGITLGTRISLAAMNTLGLKPGIRNKNLIVYTEIDRCMTDAVKIVTGCSLGHRSLKYMDYGKFAATFVDIKTGKALRGTVKEHFGNDKLINETLKIFESISDRDLVTLQEVTVNIPETDLPGSPTRKAICAICGEMAMDGRELNKGHDILCRACANGRYYR
jgi:formylmethanofuran dehydrogenase subunit E